MIEDRLLLVTHVPILTIDGEPCIDDQTCEGLIRWSENFERTAYAGIELKNANEPALSTVRWRPISDLPCASRLDLITLPRAYDIPGFISEYKRTRALLAAEIARSRYLCFTLGCLVGDWASLAAVEAIKQRRTYGVWLDRVEHEVIRSELDTMPFKRRAKETLSLPIMQRYHQALIRRSRLGLFQGMDCYQHYKPYSDRAFCVYDTHTSKADFIDADARDAKIARVLAGDPLRISYVGRAAEMKGPFDWLGVLAKIREAGVKFTATWLGDGPLLEGMKKTAADLNLTDCVQMPGFMSDRTQILNHMKQSDVFLFCHKTPESPRCLIEALVCGTPIVGYGSGYPRDLVSQDGGGDFVPVGETDALAEKLIALDRDRPALARLIGSAAQSGLRFDEQTVYSHRAGLIRQNL